MATSVSQLTIPERRSLTRLETTIGNGLASFLAVGQALMEIHDGKLYREEYSTFEDYCRDRWGFGRKRAFQLISAAGVAEEVSTNGGQIPNERQARQLVGLEPETAREVWEDANAVPGKPTAKRIEEITVKALAGMTSEERRKVIEDEETKVRTNHPPTPRDARRLKIDRGQHLLRKAVKLFDGLDDAGKRVCVVIQRALELAEAL